jgi:hypothetical protein
MVVLPVRAWDDVIVEQAVDMLIYHTLNEEVIRNCGKSLPTAYIYYLDGLLDHYSLKVWLKTNGDEVFKGQYWWWR